MLATTDKKHASDFVLLNCFSYFFTDLTFEVLDIFMETMEAKGFFQFDIIINVLASFFRFIWIPMLWVDGH